MSSKRYRCDDDSDSCDDPELQDDKLAHTQEPDADEGSGEADATSSADGTIIPESEAGSGMSAAEEEEEVVEQVAAKPRRSLREREKTPNTASTAESLDEDSEAKTSLGTLVMAHSYDTSNRFYTFGSVAGRNERVTQHIWHKVYGRQNSFRAPFERNDIVGAANTPGSNAKAVDDLEMVIV
ncbi:uncharacterized protein LOC125177581 [Hyalella azteca]|uniref:Uncharacterized protein LOC125177581 n=1 Tax=Hyalella azteca TaxID=294128 RepID=A0A979FGP6_HYAAZ|nr:uncharacterized protein LOC125177581 [Hyalella azteca]